MMEIQKIAESTTLADSKSVKIALKQMKKVPTHELHYYLGSGPNKRIPIAAGL